MFQPVVIVINWPDPTKTFFITQMLKGYGKISAHLDSRLRITLPILNRIISAASQLNNSFYDTCQFQAMCLFAFHTFSRVGEITSSVTGNMIHLNQVLKLLK